MDFLAEITKLRAGATDAVCVVGQPLSSAGLGYGFHPRGVDASRRFLPEGTLSTNQFCALSFAIIMYLKRIAI